MTWLRLNTKITFYKTNGAEISFPFVNDCETDESYEHLTDTFKMTLPTKLEHKGRNLFGLDNPIFEIGDRVKVELGYFPNLITVFEGWLTNVSAKIPMVITCEDDMWLLKNSVVTFPSKENQKFITTSKKKGKPLAHPRYVGPAITLKKLLSECFAQGASDLDFTCPDVNLGLFRVSNASIAKVLEELRNKYGLYSYFRGGKLYCGLPSNAADTITKKFVFNKNQENAIIDDSSLEFQQAKDISIKIVAKLMGANNTWEEVTVGDTDGAQRSFFLYWDPASREPKPSLKDFANLKLNEVKYTGYHGSFETFGGDKNYVRHGDIAELESDKFPERNGKYLIKSVRRTHGVNGSRQNIEIGARVS